MRQIALLFIFLFQLAQLEAQPEIKLRNPSFEDKPQHAHVPKGWKDCGLENESPPDVQPVGGSFRVTRPPSDGKTYLAMIVRDNDSWESVGQKLKKPLRKGQCYSFEIDLCRSDFYLSRSRISGDVTNYNAPVRLLIWGGNELCEKAELLGESELVMDYAWTTFSFVFEPKNEYNYISFEAYYQPFYIVPYCGNLLLDNASAILEGCMIDSQWVQSAPVEKLSIPETKDKEAFRMLLLEQGPRVHFQADEPMLEEHFYTLNTQTTLVGNKYLQKIVKAMEHVPDVKLILAVKGRFSAIETQRKLEIEKTLVRFGLKQDRFEVKIYNKDTRKESWLWTINRQDVLMRIE